jgi:hypothetical protein
MKAFIGKVHVHDELELELSSVSHSDIFSVTVLTVVFSHSEILLVTLPHFL